MSDLVDLVRRARAHDPLAWREIVSRHTPMLRARAARYRLQPADADDAVQATWLLLAEHLPGVRDPEVLGGWLTTTMSRECLRVLRSRDRAAAVEPDDVVAPDSDPSELVADADRRDAASRALRRALAALPEQRGRLIRELFAEDRRSYAEIARTCGIPVGSIGPSRARILRELRSSLQRPERSFASISL